MPFLIFSCSGLVVAAFAWVCIYSPLVIIFNPIDFWLEACLFSLRRKTNGSYSRFDHMSIFAAFPGRDLFAVCTVKLAIFDSQAV